MSGLLVAAPHSGAGKTVVALSLMRALRDGGVDVAPAKAGPDYIDATHHAVAAGSPSVNLDPWAMRPATIRALAARPGTLVVEAAMGLFDGAADGTGSSADLAAMLGLSTLLVMDCSRASQSLAAVLRGFASHRSDVPVRGVILNRVAGPRHARMVERAITELAEGAGIVHCGTIPRDPLMALPSRHLGLVPAGEREGMEAFVAGAAELVARHCDLAAVARLAGDARGTGGEASGATDREMDRQANGQANGATPVPLPPLGQRIAVARDVAFAFAYPHLLEGWRAAGASLHPFSPLADEAPDPGADAVFLPGGYPELHAGTLAAATRFGEGMRAAADRGAWIYGECGGYMVLGEGLRDADGRDHAMLGMLPLSTSFAERRLHLGYRRIELRRTTPLGAAGSWLRGHEHHHATIVHEGDAERPFMARGAEGDDLGAHGLARGRVLGSFLHVVDREG